MGDGFFSLSHALCRHNVEMHMHLVHAWDRNRVDTSGEPREGPVTRLGALHVVPDGTAETKAEADLQTFLDMQAACETRLQDLSREVSCLLEHSCS